MNQLIVTVSDPLKTADKFGSFVSYKVNINATRDGYPKGEYSVVRRFSDFYWLYKELTRAFPGHVIPAIPEKQAVGRFGNDFVESRQRGLEKFMKRVTSHPELSGSDLVTIFLQADEGGLQAAIKRTESVKPNTATKAKGWFEGTLNTLQNSGKKAEIEKSAADMQIDEIISYTTALEKQMLNVTKHSENLVKAYREDAKATNELGLSLTWLGQSEGDALGMALTQVGTASDSASSLASTHAEALNLQVAEPLDEYLRLMTSLKHTLQNRADRKAAYINALTEVEVRQAAYNKLLGVAGKEEQANAKQELVLKAQASADACKVDYEAQSEKLIVEFDNFKFEKAVDIRNVILKYVEAQIEYHKKAERIWGGLVHSVQTLDIKEPGAAPRPPPSRHHPGADACSSPQFPPSSYMGVKPVVSGSSATTRNPFQEEDETVGV